MAIPDKIKSLLRYKGLQNQGLAAYLGILPQSLQNKFARNSFTASDLIKIAGFAGAELAFIVDGKMKFVLDTNDLKGQEAGSGTTE